MHRRFDVRSLKESPKGSIHLFIRPDEGEKGLLVGKWGLNAHTLQSALDPGEVSRLEFEKGHAALILKRPRSYGGSPRDVGIGSTGLFLFKDKLALVSSDEAPLFEEGERLDGSLAGVLLHVLYQTLFHFLRNLDQVSRAADEIQEKLSTAMENKHLLSLFKLQKTLVYYEGAVNSNTAFLEILRRHAVRLGFTRAQRDFLEDVLVENAQCYRQVEDLTNVLSNLMDARASIVNNNLNILIKFLNLVMLAVMVPTLVVSVFSMNVPIPAQQHPHAFWWVLGLAVLSAGGFLAYWRGRKW